MPSAGGVQGRFASHWDTSLSAAGAHSAKTPDGPVGIESTLTRRFLYWRQAARDFLYPSRTGHRVLAVEEICGGRKQGPGPLKAETACVTQWRLVLSCGLRAAGSPGRLGRCLARPRHNSYACEVL
jgi:hypothetical protein